MATKKPFSLRPKSTDESAVEFVSQANNDPTPKVEGNELRPWEEPHVRDDVWVMVSMRLPEAYALKLRYLSKMTKVAQQELLRDLVMPWIDEQVDKY